MKKFFVLSMIAIFAALAIHYLWKPVSYEQRLIELQVEQELGETAKVLEKQPIDLKAVFLDYADDDELLLKAQIALTKYPQKASNIFLFYGAEKEFKSILRRYGDAIIPVIDYYLTGEIKMSVKMIDTLGKSFQNISALFTNEDNHTQSSTSETAGQTTKQTTAQSIEELIDKQNNGLDEFTLRKQGWYAVNFIHEEGHDFLGQFTLDKNGELKWIQTERVTEAVTAFFSSGIRTLETKYVTDEEITTGDVVWAGVDVLAVAGTLKLLRAGRVAARSGKSISLANRTRVLGAKLFRSPVALRIAKYGAIAATTYVVVTHPSLINSVLAETAEALGIPTTLFQIVVWSLALLILFYPLIWLLKRLVPPVVWVLRLVISGLLAVRSGTKELNL